tara:strand:- start:1349 stop:1792 length:444 start_codon:yes stop_codon:yes gene_type:complete
MPYSKEVYTGRFIPKNPKKYRGNVKNIVYRSSYELKFMNWCDKNEDVVEWGSEEIAIPYRSPIDNKIHRYFPDFYIKVHNKKYLIEIKPERFTKEPKIPKRKTKRFISEVKQWGVNLAKWEAAKEICLDNGWEFKIITEKELGISYK